MTTARWLVLTWALVFPTAMTWAYFVAGGGEATSLYTAGKILQFGLPVIWWAITRQRRFRRSDLSTRGLLAGCAFGLCVAAGIIALYFIWLRHHPAIEPLAAEARARMAAFGLTSPARFTLFAFFLSFIHALLEEYYWRVFVFGELRYDCSVRLATTISSVGFMAHHVVVLWVYFPNRFWSIALPFSCAVAIGGAAWAWMYHRYETIIVPWVSHALVDASLMLIGFHLLWS